MSADRIFSISGALAMLGWLILAVAGRRRWAAYLTSGVCVPLLLGIAYAAILGEHWSERTGGFDSLEHVAALFSNRWLLLAGWIHYLCFDLFIGSWQVRNAAAHGISHWLVIPCLFFTFMFGPVGLVLYFALRTVRTRSLAVS